MSTRQPWKKGRKEGKGKGTEISPSLPGEKYHLGVGWGYGVREGGEIRSVLLPLSVYVVCMGGDGRGDTNSLNGLCVCLSGGSATVLLYSLDGERGENKRRWPKMIFVD